MIVTVPHKSFLAMVDLDWYHWQERSQASFLLQQKYACQDKSFVAKKLCLYFVATKVLSQQAYFCLLRQKYACQDKTKVLSRHAYFCLLQQKYAFRDETFVATNMFVATKLVTTNMILVAAPASDV